VPPVGRPPAARNVYSFDGALVLPSELVLETSFVVDALIPSQARHIECRQFLGQMADSHTTVIFNRFLETELWEAVLKIALRELHPGQRAAVARQDGRTLRRAWALQGEVETAWRDVLTALNWFALDLEEVEPWIPSLMRYGLASFDAVHAATAFYADVTPFVTLDYHFAAVPQEQLQLWVPANRLRACGERRRARR
jgi:predicted nucleic acid-binding protein